MLLSSLGTSVANVALPTLAESFGATFQGIQWVVLAYLLAITVLIVSVGRLGDMFGHRRLLLAGLCLYAVASVLCSAATSLWILIAARGLQGLGAAIMMAVSLALAGGSIAKEKTGSAIGLLGTMSALGTALGPTLGGVLISGLGWRAIFHVTAAGATLALFLTYRNLPADSRRESKSRMRVDVLGSSLLAFTLAAYALAMTIGTGKDIVFGLALVICTVLGAGLFLLAEKRAEKPLINLSLLRGSQLSAALATSALVSTVLMATLVVGPFYLSLALGLQAGQVGLAMTVGPIVVSLCSVPAGRLVDQAGSHLLTVTGLAGIAAGCLILSLLPMTFGVSGFIGGIIVVTLGYALFQTANTTAVMKDAAEDVRGVTSGMLNLSRNLGLITGASMIGAVFALASGIQDSIATAPDAVARGMRVTFAVAGALMPIAIFIVYAHRWRRGEGSMNRELAAPLKN